MQYLKAALGSQPQAVHSDPQPAVLRATEPHRRSHDHERGADADSKEANTSLYGPPQTAPTLEPGVKAVRLVWVDNAGLRRCRLVTAARFLQSVHSQGVGLTKACMAMPAHQDSPVPNAGLSAVGEVRLKPCIDTLSTLPYMPQHAVVLTRFTKPKGGVWEFCSRTLLETTAAALLKEYGLKLRVGFETEFVLLKRAPEPPVQLPQAIPPCSKPVDNYLYCQTAAVDQHAAVLDEMVECLEQMGIGVVQYHAEAAPGQFEIATEHYPVVEAADKLLLTREIIAGVARKHGMDVTYLPKPMPKEAGSGCHCHFSLWRDDGSAMLDKQQQQQQGTGAGPRSPMFSTELSHFVAGVLKVLDALLPFTLPTPNSYQRLKPGAWAGAYQAFGWDNRECPVRVTAPDIDHLDLMHVELKAVDNTCNPYMALSALIVAGMLGLFSKAQLPEPCQVPPAELDEATRARLGAHPLPTSLTAALEAFQRREPFRLAMESILGKPAVDAFIAVRRAEAEANCRTEHLLLRYS